jgi:hypothetical protein
MAYHCTINITIIMILLLTTPTVTLRKHPMLLSTFHNTAAHEQTPTQPTQSILEGPLTHPVPITTCGCAVLCAVCCSALYVFTVTTATDIQSSSQSNRQTDRQHYRNIMTRETELHTGTLFTIWTELRTETLCSPYRLNSPISMPYLLPPHTVIQPAVL